MILLLLPFVFFGFLAYALGLDPAWSVVIGIWSPFAALFVGAYIGARTTARRKRRRDRRLRERRGF